jgi:hypothetical protein
MIVDELFNYIYEKSGFLPRSFAQWVKSSDRFRIFAEEYKDKICEKFAEAKSNPEPDEKLKDTLFELEIAYLVLKASGFSVKYELFGEGPDFTFTTEKDVNLNIEVKRIRKSNEEKQLEAWREAVKREIQVVPSTLAVGLDIGLYEQDYASLLDLLARLECKKADVIEYITKTINADEKNVPTDGGKRYSIPSFEDEVEFVLRKPSGKPGADHTSFYGGGYPIIFTQQEWKQFKDLIFDKKNQRIPDMINILAINTRSAAHDVYAFMEEIETDFMERVVQDNVTEQMRKLSGIFFRGAYENWVWQNIKTARCPIPDDIFDTLVKLE